MKSVPSCHKTRQRHDQRRKPHTSRTNVGVSVPKRTPRLTYQHRGSQTTARWALSGTRGRSSTRKSTYVKTPLMRRNPRGHRNRCGNSTCKIKDTFMMRNTEQENGNFLNMIKSFHETAQLTSYFVVKDLSPKKTGKASEGKGLADDIAAHTQNPKVHTHALTRAPLSLRRGLTKVPRTERAHNNRCVSAHQQQTT